MTKCESYRKSRKGIRDDSGRLRRDSGKREQRKRTVTTRKAEGDSRLAAPKNAAGLPDEIDKKEGVTYG